jgi:sugar phosphate isomerase/epimerase
MSSFILSAFADEIDPSLDVQINVLKQYDIRYIEMRGVNGRNITQHTISEVKEIRKKLDDNGFGISAVGSPIGKIGIKDDFIPHLDLFKHTLEIASVLGTKYIRMFSFYIPKGDDPGKYKDEVISRWDSFVKAASTSGIMLLHENEKDIYGDTPLRCLDLMEAFDGETVRSIFDPANFIQCDVQTYPYAYELLKDHIEYMHIKDALFSDHGVVPSGYGDGKIPEILKKLYDRGFRGFLSLEPHLGSFKGLAELELSSKYTDLPEGGPKLFAAAAEALVKIIKGIEG